MTNENDLIRKLMVSKQIMEKHTQIPRNTNGVISEDFNTPEVEEFKAPKANYNLPQEFLQETKNFTKETQEMSQDKILSSRLPDEIKRLMIEHPIAQPKGVGTTPTISNELVEKASRLMNTNAAGNTIKESKTSKPTQSFTGLDAETIKSIVRETVQEVLSENGLLVESTQKSNESISFRVGKHIFEGKVTKIKKIQ